MHAEDRARARASAEACSTAAAAAAASSRGLVAQQKYMLAQRRRAAANGVHAACVSNTKGKDVSRPPAMIDGPDLNKSTHAAAA